MKLKIALVLAICLMLVLGLAGIAGAQSICNSITFPSGAGEPGSVETVCGSAGAGNNVTVFFDGTEAGSAIADEYGEYCAAFSVPADATLGTHMLEVSILQQETNCSFDYAVEAASTAPDTQAPVVETAPATAPTTLPATLPATGFMLVPAAGMLAGGIGMLLFRKRHR